MAAKTLEEFYKEYRSGFNYITGEKNNFKDLTDQMIWDAAIKSVKENGSSHNTDCAVPPKLPSLDDVMEDCYDGCMDEDTIKEVYESIKKLGNFS